MVSISFSQGRPDLSGPIVRPFCFRRGRLRGQWQCILDTIDRIQRNYDRRVYSDRTNDVVSTAL